MFGAPGAGNPVLQAWTIRTRTGDDPDATRKRHGLGERVAIETRDTVEAAWAAADRAISRADGLQNTAAALARVLTTGEVADVALREGLAALGAGRGMVGVLEPDGHTIRTVSEAGFKAPITPGWATFDVGDDAPLAEAIRLREPIVIQTADELRARYPSLMKMVPADGGPAVVVPLIYEDRTVGGMYFRYAEAGVVADADAGYLAALGRQCAAALERASLYEQQAQAWREAAAATHRIGYLARVGEALVEAADIEAALPTIAALAVPEVADWAGVFLIAPDGSIDLVSLQHRDPERLASVRRLIAATPPTIDGPGVGAAIRTAEVQIVSDYQALIDAADAPDAIKAVFRDADIRSVMHCPLVGDAIVFGAVTLATVSDRLFTEADASFGAELGRRVGTALEKVQLNASLRQRMAELRDRDERLELALAASRTGIWEWNIQSGRVLLSDEVCRLHGLPLGTELPSLDAYLELVHPDDREGIRTALEAALDSGTYDAEYRIRLPDGTVRWARGAARVFLDEEQQPVRMVGIGQDVTDRRAVEEERERLLEAERRAGELGQVFIGIVSHELRTPITMILGGAQLLQKLPKPANADTRLELIDDIEAEAERLYRLTEDLIVLTRVERGGLDLGSEPVLLRRLLEGIVRSESARWPEVRIVLKADLDLPVVVGDPTYVEQLVRNLLGNAAKYGGPGGEIEVTATPNETEIEVRVLDHGPGLAEDDINRVFDLFYRSPTTAKLAKGAGIGLFVCAQLARAMGGRVWAANRPGGGGGEFGFALRQYVGETIEERIAAEQPYPVMAQGGAPA
jgi:PAS domain S-box-containing protein